MTRAPLSLLLLGLLLAPGALADLAPSHRLHVFGRVIDVDGRPVPSQQVDLVLAAFPSAAPCLGGRPPVTDARGDFVVCRHVHEVPREVGATLTVAGESRTFLVDGQVRRAAVHVQLPNATAQRDLAGEREVETTFRVLGRLFLLLERPTVVDDVEVWGVPVHDEVEVDVVGENDTVLVSGTDRSDENGDYAVTLPMGALPEGAVVVVRSGGAIVAGEASPTFRRADVDVVHERVERPPPPGTHTPKIPGPGFASMLVAAGVAAYAWRRPVSPR